MVRQGILLKHLAKHRIIPTTENYTAQNVYSAKIEQVCPKLKMNLRRTELVACGAAIPNFQEIFLPMLPLEVLETRNISLLQSYLGNRFP